MIKRLTLTLMFLLSTVIITTAQLRGRAAPVLVEAATVDEMRPGAVIVDLAASTGLAL